MRKLLALALMLCLLAPAALAEEDYTVDMMYIPYGSVNTGVSVHDPSVVAADGTYYIFGSHMAAAKSTNLRSWTAIANGYRADNPVWGDLFAEGLHVFDYAGARNSLIPTDDGGTHVWAPDVIWNPVMGKWMMYYCTSSTFNASNLCFALSDSVEGPYEWQGALVCSGFEEGQLAEAGVLDVVDEASAKRYLTLAGGYDYKSWPNAIDPSVFFDAEGRLWMVYGSWSGGIFLLELDPATGLVIHPEEDKARRVDPYFGKHLMGGNHQSMEGPCILWDAEAGYYYLFVSYGALTAKGGYQIRVFRSETPDGEYVDMAGAQPNRRGGHAAYGLKLSGNYLLPSFRNAYMATGHNSALIDRDGKRYIVCHTRYDNGTEYHQPLVRQYALNAEGWPCVLPYATAGEDIAPLAAQDVPGRYFVVNQGMDISGDVPPLFILYLREDGTLGGENVSGTWTREEGKIFLRLTLGEKAFSGVMAQMEDDGEEPVTVFSAVGGNESLWGVKYED